MNLTKKCLLVISACCLFTGVAQANNETLWEDQTEIASRGLATKTIHNERGVKNARSLTLNIDAMKSLLVPASSNGDVQARASIQPTIELPLPNGSNVTLSLESTNILPPALAQKFTSIKSYKVAEANGDIIAGRVDFTELGFHAMLQTSNGQTLFIDPASNESTQNYLSYRKSEQLSTHTAQHGDDEVHSTAFTSVQNRLAARTRSNEGIIEYRIAVAATAEYTQLQGGTKSAALSAMVTTLNRVNHVYEQSLGIRLSLVEQNDKLIYTDSSSDPYSNYSIEKMLAENQSNLDSVIGSANYDIGHVFGTSGGGLAYIGSVCSAVSKARGASGIRNPNNDSFDVDYVAHEIGHQFGATHTFNSSQGICTTGARTSRSAFEPGSGSSIMSYAGGCGTDNVQSFADAMFHSGNIEQINNNVLTGPASSCGILHQSNNTAPMAIAGNSYTIPAHTPFELKAQAVDADNDALLYSWEQIDLGSASTLKTDLGNNPLFRVLPPTTDSSRSFPATSTILGSRVVTGETLPSTDRTMDFQIAVYDGHHSPSLDRVSLTVVNSGEAFKLHSEAAQYKQGANSTIYWNTANTQSAPISCTSVDLSLSTDGGSQFDIALASSIPNTGSATVYLPDNIVSTNTGRFKLSCSNNIFFSISSNNFTIDQNAQAQTIDTRNVENTDLAEINTSGGGGSMGFMLLSLLLVVSTLRKRRMS